MKRFAVWSAVLVLLTPGWAHCQFGVIGTSSTRSATGPNNSHKLAYHSEMLFPAWDTVTLVFQSNNTIYLAVSGNGEINPWQVPVALYPGADPAITCGSNNERQLVWQMLDTAGGRLNIFYCNLEYRNRMVPVNVSTTSQDCFHPDVYGDSLGVAHIVWEENEGTGRRVYYRQANVNGVIGERFAVASALTSAWALPAIEKFNNGIAVVWAHCDSTQNPPVYKIMRRRQLNGVWQPEEVLVEHNEPLNRPALDFGTEGEDFSGCWEMVVSGNSEVQFYGGNGGGYPTAGVSTAPVVSTVGRVWSYLFWEEDSAGNEDINTHFYYFMTGWTQSSIRRFFSINAPIYAPSCLGALAVWTQGDSAPYQVMWGFFDYAVGTPDQTRVRRAGEGFTTIVRDRLVLPAGVNTKPAAGGLVLSDIAGNRVLKLKPGFNDVSRLAPGVYFIRSSDRWQRVVIIR
ncbi:MAG: hypothetical protein ACPL0F_05100 [bacterium]|jgi:hypothetical protein